MADPVDTLLVDIRANTQGFAQDVARLRATFDGTLVDGLSRAGGVLERSLTGALRRGSLGFEDLRRVALGVLDAIALRAAATVGAERCRWRAASRVAIRNGAGKRAAIRPATTLPRSPGKVLSCHCR